jgi:hypothetical protein
MDKLWQLTIGAAWQIVGAASAPRTSFCTHMDIRVGFEQSIDGGEAGAGNGVR